MGPAAGRGAPGAWAPVPLTASPVSPPSAAPHPVPGPGRSPPCSPNPRLRSRLPQPPRSRSRWQSEVTVAASLPGPDFGGRRPPRGPPPSKGPPSQPARSFKPPRALWRPEGKWRRRAPNPFPSVLKGPTPKPSSGDSDRRIGCSRRAPQSPTPSHLLSPYTFTGWGVGGPGGTGGRGLGTGSWGRCGREGRCSLPSSGSHGAGSVSEEGLGCPGMEWGGGLPTPVLNVYVTRVTFHFLPLPLLPHPFPRTGRRSPPWARGAAGARGTPSPLTPEGSLMVSLYPLSPPEEERPKPR